MTRRKKAERPSTESDCAAKGKKRGRATVGGGVEPVRTDTANRAANPAAATINRCPSQTAERPKLPTSVPGRHRTPRGRKAERELGMPTASARRSQPEPDDPFTRC